MATNPAGKEADMPICESCKQRRADVDDEGDCIPCGAALRIAKLREHGYVRDTPAGAVVLCECGADCDIANNACSGEVEAYDETDKSEWLHACEAHRGSPDDE